MPQSQIPSSGPSAMAPAMALALTANFGSVEGWRDDFGAKSKSSAASAGRVQLCFNARNGTLAHRDARSGATNDPSEVCILELDAHEHRDVHAFIHAIDWQSVYDRYQAAVHDATESLAVDHSAISGAQLLDVRRAGVFDQARQMIPGATWRDPTTVKDWADSLPPGKEVVVYCVYGHEVGRATALRLRAQGVDAKFLQGGIDGWSKAGLPVIDKGGAPVGTRLTFESAAPGAAPTGWVCGSTGGGSPRWTVESSESTGGTALLKQSGSGRFPWCVKSDSAASNGSVEVKFKALAGRQDQAGGVVWRFKDGDNYYVARANALEDNVSLYYTKGGTRHTIRYVDASVASNVWHLLQVEFSGTRIRVSLDGKLYIEEDDHHISGSGKVGVWTKADSVTVFDAFSYSAA